MTMDSNVVKFPYSVSRRAHARKPRRSESYTPEELAPLREMIREEIDNLRRGSSAAQSLSTTPTAVNSRLHIERREAWRKAEAATRYWRQRIRFVDAIFVAQRMELPEGRSHPPVCDTGLVEKWRAAIVEQLLTPAPDGGAVKWKQAAIAADNYLDVKPERVERAIADDLAFLAAHPTRRSSG